jgi:RNA polymerase sigma-70 factor (ECF subfamily)
MTQPLWCGPGSNADDDARRARRYIALLSDAESAGSAPSTGVADRDLELLERLRAGDDRTFEVMYRAYVPRLLDFAERYVAADIAEDVVQAVMTSVWHRRRTLTVRSTVSAYLFGAVRQEVLLYERHRRVVARHAGRAVDRAEVGGPVCASAESQVMVEELRAALRRAIESLPERTREVLTLRWVEELQYAEIADVLGISESAAKMHVHRAQARVRPLLERFREP